MQTIAVIDYGMGNLRSVYKAIEHVGGRDVRVLVTSSGEEIKSADRIVFPGQGAAAACMSALQSHHLNDIVLEVANSKPFLGICMGLQVLMSHSDENNGTACLSKIDGHVKYFDYRENPVVSKLKIPHMGWNHVVQSKYHPLWEGIENHARFYFVHSYYVLPSDSNIVAAKTEYGVDFASAVTYKNIFAVQFHPEKSAKDGLILLKNFINWSGES